MDPRPGAHTAGHPAERAFGPLLRRYRLERGLTQEALAERAGLGVRSISDMERGVPHAPRKDTLALLADALALAPAERVTFEAAARWLRRFPPTRGTARSDAGPGSAIAEAPRAWPLNLAEQATAAPSAVPGASGDHVRPPDAGENRVLTILWADLPDALERTAGLHPEEAAALLDQVLTAMAAAIHRYEGRINRLLGEGLLACFGTPQAHENDPERAILAALELRAAVQRLGFTMRAGITTGAVNLGVIGMEQQREITVHGHVVTLAARLRETAQPGQILVGETVYRHTRRTFAFAAQPVEVPGVSQAVPAYVVARPLPHPAKMRGIEGLRAALIGRDDEIARLTAALAAVRTGPGQMATLVGDAGVGKSRLIEELKAAAHAPVAGQPVPLWLEGRCLDIGVAVSYGPFLDLLRTLFALSPEEDERARGDRIAAAVRTLVGPGDLTLAHAAEMLPVLGHLLAARFGDDRDERMQAAGPEQLKQQTFLAVRDLFLALAQRQPVVLILEDVHWADSLSLDLIALLMDSLPHAALFLVCAYRPDRKHKSGRLATLAARKCPERYTELHLRELSPPQSRLLLESLLHDEALPASVTEQILAQAQGNPFFVEEVVRALIDAGLLCHDGSVWQAGAQIGAVAVPDTVQSVILSRVDRLDGPAKHVLQYAAVIGRLFRRRLVGAVARLDEGGAADTVPVLDCALEDLEDRQLIYQERAIPEVEYSFQHALTQETVYHNILRRHCTQVHRAVAEAVEQLYAESLPDFCEQLAYHYEQAGVVEKAIDYQLKAGEKAQRAYLHQEALTYFQRALAHLEVSPVGEAHPEWTLAALTGLGRVLRFLEKLADAESYLRRALALGQELHQPARALALVYFLLGEVLYHQNRFAEMVQIGEEGLALLGDDTESTEAALMTYTIAAGHAGHMLQRDFDQACKYYLRIARLIKTLPYSAYWGTFLWSVDALLAAKDVAQALEVVQHAESVAQHHSADLALAGMIQAQRAQILYCSGDLRGAVAHLKAALDYHARTDSITERFNWSWLAEKCLALGDLRGAAEYAERVRPALLSETLVGRVERDERLLGMIALCVSAVDAATAHLEAAMRSLQGPSPKTMLPLGRAYLAQGRREEAMRQFEEALASATPADMIETGVYRPYVRLLPNALSGLEEAAGSGERVRALVERLRHESVLAPLLPRVPCLVPMGVGPVRPQRVHEEFTTPLAPGWTWHDPFGDCSFAVQDGLHITAANGRDLWHVNLSAPRLLRPAPSADFAVQTICGPASDEAPASGGLLLWQDTEHYLVLERGHWGAADISFRGCLDNADRIVGRGWLPGEQTWLRLERRGTTVRALCSVDGVAWLTAGEMEFPARAVEQVGVHAIGLIDRTIYHGAYPEGSAICFRSFDLWATAAA